MTKRIMNDGCRMTLNPDGTIKGIELPDHLKPDISLEDTWYQDMMSDIEKRLRLDLQTRTPPVDLSNDLIEEIAKRINAEASHIANVENESKGRGRPINVGSELAAAGAQKIAADFNLPASGDWEESLTADLLTLIESCSRKYKCRIEPTSGNRKARLVKGRNWKITDL